MKTLDETLAAHTDLSTSLVADMDSLRQQTLATHALATSIQSSTAAALSTSALDSAAITQRLDDMAAQVSQSTRPLPSPTPLDTDIPALLERTTTTVLESIQDIQDSLTEIPPTPKDTGNGSDDSQPRTPRHRHPRWSSIASTHFGSTNTSYDSNAAYMCRHDVDEGPSISPPQSRF
jgi:hypothetical protein